LNYSKKIDNFLSVVFCGSVTSRSGIGITGQHNKYNKQRWRALKTNRNDYMTWSKVSRTLNRKYELVANKTIQ